MPIYNLTKERIEELRKERDVKMQDFANLEGKTPENMYDEELDDFLKSYKQFLKVKESESQSFGEKKKIIRKKK